MFHLSMKDTKVMSEHKWPLSFDLPPEESWPREHWGLCCVCQRWQCVAEEWQASSAILSSLPARRCQLSLLSLVSLPVDLTSVNLTRPQDWRGRGLVPVRQFCLGTGRGRWGGERGGGWSCRWTWRTDDTRDCCEREDNRKLLIISTRTLWVLSQSISPLHTVILNTVELLVLDSEDLSVKDVLYGSIKC